MGVQNFEFHYFLGFQKKKYLFRYEDFVDIFFRGHHKIGLYLGANSLHFRVFSKGQGTEWVIFLGVGKISNMFFGCLKFQIFFGVNGRCWIRAYE